VAAVCLHDQESRQLTGEEGLNESTQLFASLAGLAIVAVQVGVLVTEFHCRHGEQALTEVQEPRNVVATNVEAFEREEQAPEAVEANPLAADKQPNGLVLGE
jgi:hypothetical protein